MCFTSLICVTYFPPIKKRLGWTMLSGVAELLSLSTHFPTDLISSITPATQDSKKPWLACLFSRFAFVTWEYVSDSKERENSLNQGKLLKRSENSDLQQQSSPLLSHYPREFILVCLGGRQVLSDGHATEIVYRPSAIKQGKWSDCKIKEDLEEWKTGEW